MAKRRLSNFNFESEGSHIALVHANQGGPANGVDYALITKSTKDITQKEVEKATEVQVTMNIVDFLCKFYGLWYDDALVLATIFGYDVGEAGYSFEESARDYEDYLQEKVDAVTIMKSLVMDKSKEDIAKAVGSLSSKDYLSVLKVQEHFEKNLDAASEKVAAIKKSSGVTAEGVTAAKAANSPSVEIKQENEDSMTEFVTKAALDAAIEKAVQAAVSEKDVQLTKALSEIQAFKIEKEESVTKSRKAAIGDVEKDEAAAEELFKATKDMPEEAFAVIVKALQKEKEKVEQSDLLKEVGSQGREVTPEKPDGANKTADLLKAQFQKEGAK